MFFNLADVLIKYNGNEQIVTSDDDGYFEYNITDTIPDGTEIEFTSNVSSSFIYGSRLITSLYNGELSLMDATKTFTFSLVPISTNPIIFGKNRSVYLKVVDSRVNSTDWKVYAYIEKTITSQGGYTLPDALVFTGANNNGDSEITLVTWSREKGPLLDLTNDALEINEEYFAEIIFVLEE